jgi:hypothetical protein
MEFVRSNTDLGRQLFQAAGSPFEHAFLSAGHWEKQLSINKSTKYLSAMEQNMTCNTTSINSQHSLHGMMHTCMQPLTYTSDANMYCFHQVFCIVAWHPTKIQNVHSLSNNPCTGQSDLSNPLFSRHCSQAYCNAAIKQAFGPSKSASLNPLLPNF